MTPTQHTHTPNWTFQWTHLLFNNTYTMSTADITSLWPQNNNIPVMSTEHASEHTSSPTTPTWCQHSHTPNRTCLRTHLLSFGDATAGDDDDLTLLLKVHHFSHAVGTAGVVDVTGRAARHGGVDHRVVVNAEHVHTTVLEETEKKTKCCDSCLCGRKALLVK